SARKNAIVHRGARCFLFPDFRDSPFPPDTIDLLDSESQRITYLVTNVKQKVRSRRLATVSGRQLSRKNRTNCVIPNTTAGIPMQTPSGIAAASSAGLMKRGAK